MLSVVLHPDVVNFLRINTVNNRLQQQTWDCINQLRLRQFTGGLRVKKLQGVSKRVWEARINLSSRLIFTYNKSKLPETGKVGVYIVVQDICDHDNLNRKIARVRTEDATWLDSKIMKELGDIESDLMNLTIEDRNRIAYYQLEEEDCNPELIYPDELLGNIQWQVVESVTEWEQAIINKERDLLLKITAEEYRLATSRHNILLKGTAGTGKTTVALYRMLHDYEQNPHYGKRLYVAYSALLVNNVREQFYKLVGKKNQEIDEIFHFQTFRDLCLDILKEAGESYYPEDEVDFQYFDTLYSRQREFKRYPSALVWDQIRSIIKGQQLNLNLDYLNQKEYYQLSHRCQNLVSPEHRSTIYNVSSWYHNYLSRNHRFDEIDLTRKALRIINHQQIRKYHLIVCDEVQDFAKLQLELLMQLITPGANLYFAGDKHQMISPSGFDWKNLTTIFHDHQLQQPNEHELKCNFRSVGTLVNLSHQVLKIRYRLLQKTLPELPKAVSNFGEKARIVAASLNDITTHLNTLNPDDAILVRTDENREYLRSTLKSSLVFTIEEAKGLEFDTVFLLDFFQYRQQLWETIFNTPERLRDNEKPALVLELNLLYVAITRARRILNIWEENIAQFWQEHELLGHWENKNIHTVLENRVGSEQEDWQKRGEYYFQAEFYLQAIECFEKSGNKVKVKESRAKLLQRESNYQEAAKIFVELGNWQTAAELFERVENWQSAANCWQKIREYRKQRICETYLLEETGEFLKAAQEWEALEMYTKAAGDFEKLEQWQSAANCWSNVPNYQRQRFCEIKDLESQEKWEEAAQEWGKIKRDSDERRCWMSSNNEPKKAEYRGKDYEREEKWLLAYEQYTIAGIEDKVREMRKQAIKSLMQSGEENLDNKNYQAALVDYNQVLELNYKNAIAYLKRGVAKTRQKDYMGAIEDCNQAIKIDPGYADAYSHRGKVYQILSRRDFDKAMEIRQR
jgi:superfamily I DNA/RNA helicase/Txe/YoeB family toxin of Txe-Axe toxin-antitoxin module